MVKSWKVFEMWGNSLRFATPRENISSNISKNTKKILQINKVSKNNRKKTPKNPQESLKITKQNPLKIWDNHLKNTQKHPENSY